MGDIENSASAAQTVFAIPELFDEIFQNSNMRELYRFQRVSKAFQCYILSSPRLRRMMYLSPSLTGTVVPLIVPDRPLRGVVKRNKVIWAKQPKISSKTLEAYGILGPTGPLPMDVLVPLCGPNPEIPRPVVNPSLNHKDVNWKCDIIRLQTSPVSHAERGLRLVPGTIDLSFANDSRRHMLITQPPAVDVVIGRSDTMWGIFEVHNENGVTVADVIKAEQERNPTNGAVNSNGRAFAGWGYGRRI